MLNKNLLLIFFLFAASTQVIQSTSTLLRSATSLSETSLRQIDQKKKSVRLNKNQATVEVVKCSSPLQNNCNRCLAQPGNCVYNIEEKKCLDRTKDHVLGAPGFSFAISVGGKGCILGCDNPPGLTCIDCVHVDGCSYDVLGTKCKKSLSMPEGAINWISTGGVCPADIENTLDVAAKAPIADSSTCYPTPNAFLQSRDPCPCEKIEENLVTQKTFVLGNVAGTPNQVVVDGAKSDQMVKQTLFILDQEIPASRLEDSVTVISDLRKVTEAVTLTAASSHTREERLMKGASTAAALKSNKPEDKAVINAIVNTDVKFSSSPSPVDSYSGTMLVERLKEIHGSLYVITSDAHTVTNGVFRPAELEVRAGNLIEFVIFPGNCPPETREVLDVNGGPLVFLPSVVITSVLTDFFNELSLDLKANPQNLLSWAAKSLMLITAVHPFGDGNGRASRVFVDSLFYDAGLSPCILEVELLAIFPRIDASIQPSPTAVVNMLLSSCRKTMGSLINMYEEAHPGLKFPDTAVPNPAPVDVGCPVECECCNPTI